MTELSGTRDGARDEGEPPTGGGGSGDVLEPLHRPQRWSKESRQVARGPGLDLFWPVLVLILATFVVVVSVVAHSSMASVGVDGPRVATRLPSPAPTSGASFVIVQLASFPTRQEAQEQAQEVRTRTGLAAKVLQSQWYQPMDAGWYVVYLGPFDDTAAGLAEAASLVGEASSAGDAEDALVRTLSRR